MWRGRRRAPGFERSSWAPARPPPSAVSPFRAAAASLPLRPRAASSSRGFAPAVFPPLLSSRSRPLARAPADLAPRPFPVSPLSARPRAPRAALCVASGRTALAVGRAGLAFVLRCAAVRDVRDPRLQICRTRRPRSVTPRTSRRCASSASLAAAISRAAAVRGAPSRRRVRSFSTRPPSRAGGVRGGRRGRGPPRPRRQPSREAIRLYRRRSRRGAPRREGGSEEEGEREGERERVRVRRGESERKRGRRAAGYVRFLACVRGDVTHACWTLLCVCVPLPFFPSFIPFARSVCSFRSP